MKLNLKINHAGIERFRLATALLKITQGDLAGPVLTSVAQVHRRQEKQVFASEGASGFPGPWPPLSPAYMKRKRAAMRAERSRKAKSREAGPGQFSRIARRRGGPPPISLKILVWTGDTKDRFITPSRPENVEEFVPVGPVGGVMRFGARSRIGSYHFRGNRYLPRRDMISKTRAQNAELLGTIVTWYRRERLPQVARAIRSAR